MLQSMMNIQLSKSTLNLYIYIYEKLVKKNSNILLYNILHILFYKNSLSTEFLVKSNIKLFISLYISVAELKLILGRGRMKK